MTRRVLSFLLCIVMVLSFLPVVGLAADGNSYVVAGVDALCGSNWDGTDANNQMTENAGIYTKLYSGVAVGEYQFKIVRNGTDWIGDATGNNVTFNVVQACDVTITFNPATNEIKVSGDGVQMVTELEVESIRTVGNGDGKWLNGANWDPADDANKMTEVSQKVYQITYNGIEAYDDYQFKFAANGSWSDNWGAASSEAISVGGTYDAIYNSGNNIYLNITAETADVIITLDLTQFDYATKTGATYTVEIIEDQEIPIDIIAVTGVTAPVAGETAGYDFTLPEGAGYAKYDGGDMGNLAWVVSDSMPSSAAEVENAPWYLVSDSEPLVFEAGKYYSVVAMLDAAPGYVLDKDVTATLNGEEAALYIYNDYEFDVIYTFYCEEEKEPQLIDTITITGVTAPVAGEDANFEFVIPENAGYSIGDNGGGKAVWVKTEMIPANYDELSADSVEWIWDDGELTFEADYYYTFIACVHADEGYVMADSIIATMNGEAATATEWTTDDIPFDAVDVWYTFYCADPDHPVDPDPTDPTTPADPSNPQTGESDMIVLWLALFVLSSFAVAAVCMEKKWSVR